MSLPWKIVYWMVWINIILLIIIWWQSKAPQYWHTEALKYKSYYEEVDNKMFNLMIENKELRRTK